MLFDSQIATNKFIKPIKQTSSCIYDISVEAVRIFKFRFILLHGMYFIENLKKSKRSGIKYKFCSSYVFLTVVYDCKDECGQTL